MKVAIWINPDYCENVGGGYSYYDRLIHAIDKYQFDPSLEICFVTEGDNVKAKFEKEIICLSHKNIPTFIERIKCKIPMHRHRFKLLVEKRIEQDRNRDYVSQLLNSGVDVIYYPIQSLVNVMNFPFIISNWDIGHRSSYTFPELIQYDEFTNREFFYDNILPKALMVLCESDAGRKELLSYTNINPERVKVMHLFAGEVVNTKKDNDENILSQYGLMPKNYFYYPAQFWAHKNHYSLLKAFMYFVESHPDFKLVLSGSDFGNLSYIKDCCSKWGMNAHVVFTGFVSKETVNVFYSNATAMVMPTHLGPTNMPLLEAMELGCPVICSDFPGHHEELGDAALYINPTDIVGIRNAMEIVTKDRETYVKEIMARSNETPFNINNALEEFNKALVDIASIRNCWK